MSSSTWTTLVTESAHHRPMVFAVDTGDDGTTDHAITVIGYRETPTRQYASWDTWSRTIRWEDFAPAAQGQPGG